jgi:aryl-alcohol dehydrogenase-like predicted oxidoreductase
MTLTYRPLGRSSLKVSPLCFGGNVFGWTVDEAASFSLLDAWLDAGFNFIDTADVYSRWAPGHSGGESEAIIGKWLKASGKRDRVVLATKVGMDMGDGKAGLKPAYIRQAVEDSLRRLQTDRIDLYQIHWPNRNSPAFGTVYFDPKQDKEYTSVREQLEALAKLVKAGKVRHIGLSNETPYGVCEFVHLAEQHGLPRVATVQNPYALTSRLVDNGLDEAMHRHQVSLLAYSPLAFGALTGKYDQTGIHGEAKPGRLAIFPTMKAQRWGRKDALTAAQQYNALARRHGLTPTKMALAFVYGNWRVASTIIGVTKPEQLDENIDAWGTTLSKHVLGEIDDIRWQHRDPAL